MAGLPRPDVPDGPVRDFFDGLHDLHHRAGWPSLRTMAKEVGCSHTTVSAGFAGPAVPRWGLVELLVEALGGDTGRFRDLWLAASAPGRAPAPPPSPPPAVPPPPPVSPAVPELRPAAGPGTAPRQLPADIAGFTGRAGQLADLDRLRAQADASATAVPIIVLAGTAGVGKTALAIRWAHRMAPAYPDGQLFLNLRGYDRDRPVGAAEALESLLWALGVPDSAVPDGLPARAAQFRSLLAGRRTLLLLDNVNTVDQVRDLLPGTPGCLVLATSRSTLPSLVARHGAVRVNLDVLSAGEAAELLRGLIGDRLDAEPAQGAALARLCARLPLALRIAAELAASRPALPLAALVTELGDASRQLDLLAAGDDDYTAVRSVFSWSSRHLPEDAAAAFALLGVHPGEDFDAAAAAALVGAEPPAARRLLDVLLRAHLMEERAPGRFGMHDLLHAYAAEQAAARPDRVAALGRLLAHYQALAARAAGPDAPDAELEAERANLLAAARAAAHDVPAETVLLAARLAPWLDTRAHYRDGLALHALAAQAAATLGDAAAEGAALHRLGIAHLRMGAYGEARDHHRRALGLHEAAGDRSGQADARHGLGTVAWRLGDHGEAQEQLEAALQIRRSLGDVPGEGAALYGLGTVYRQVGDYRAALAHQRRALALYRQCGDRIGEGRVLNNLGTTLERMGEHAQAHDHYLQALTRNRELGNRVGEAVALTNLGWACARLGRQADALARHAEAVPLYLETGYRVGEADALHGLGVVHRLAGRLAEAADHLARAAALARDIGEADTEAGALVDLGETHRATGDPAAAAAYRDALALCTRTGDRYQEARALSGLAHLDRAAGDTARAARGWRDAAALFTALGVPEAAETAGLLAALP